MFDWRRLFDDGGFEFDDFPGFVEYCEVLRCCLENERVLFVGKLVGDEVKLTVLTQSCLYADKPLICAWFHNNSARGNLDDFVFG